MTSRPVADERRLEADVARTRDGAASDARGVAASDTQDVEAHAPAQAGALAIGAGIRGERAPVGTAATDPGTGADDARGEGPSARTRASTERRASAEHDIRVGGLRVELTPHNCFACGQLNVHGLQIELHAADGRCWTELILADRFEGWEGIAHGGILCTLLDEVMAWALIDQDSWGVTARMSVSFKRPVAIGEPIRAEGWIMRARRRLLETEGRIVDGRTGDVLATSTATYIAASEDRKRQLKAKYRFRIGPRSAADDDTVEGGAARAARPDAAAGSTRP